MTYLLQWLPWVGLAAAMIVVWVGSTYFWLRLAKIPAPAAAAVSPAVTTALILVLSIVFERAGWFWSGGRVLPVLGVIGVAGAATFFAHPSRLSPARGRYNIRFLTLGFSSAALVGWLLAALPTMLVAPPNNPPQQWDPSFHLNGVWGITQVGVGAPGAGLAHNYGWSDPDGYPIGWHSFTSLFATGPTTVQAANATSLALMLVWIVGAAVYTYTLYPSRTAATAAAVIAGTLPSMPADALTAYSQWPNAMSVALLPGGATVMILLGRSALSSMGVLTRKGLPGSLRLTASQFSAGKALKGSWGHTSLLFVVVLLSTLGGVMAHQVYAFNLVFLLIPAVTAGWLRIMWWAARRRKWGAQALGAAAAALAITLFTWAELRPEVASMRSYPRDGVSLATGISQALIPNPPWGLTLGLAMFNAVFAVLMVAGLLRIITSRVSRGRWLTWGNIPRPLLWPIWSYLTYATLIFFAYGPNWAIRTWIVGPWFNDGRRVMEPASLAMIPLLAVGFALLSHWLVTWWTDAIGTHNRQAAKVLPACLGALLLAASGFGALDARIAAARSVLDANHLGRSGMADQEMLDLMRELPNLIPEDALVLGDPKAGVMYSQVIGQRWAYFPQLSLLSDDDATQDIITERFGNLLWDPEVCDAIRETGITHFVSVPDGAYYGVPRSDRMPGLYNVDTTVGFELVARGGSASLYEITACETE